MENKYCVYRHRRLDNNQVFYVGMGDIKRPSNKSGRNNYWKNIVNKHGYNIEILYENLNLEEAFELEEFLIKVYGRIDLKTGILCNMTDGGDGCFGLKRSEEAIKKFKETYKNRTEEQRKITSELVSNAVRNRVVSDETKLKLSIANKGNKYCLGRIYTDEQKRQISISNKNKKHIYKSEESFKNTEKTRFQKGCTINNKKVINVETGEIYESAKILAEKLGICAKLLRARITSKSKTIKKYLYLENKEKKQLICCYGTLRRGFGNHRLLTNAEYIGTFNTPPIYDLHDLGGFPGLKNDGKTSVVMEVYAVNEQEARRVDMLEGYEEGRTPTFYDKEFIETPWGKAGVYIYVDNLDRAPIVESGDYYLHRKGKKSEEHSIDLTTI